MSTLARIVTGRRSKWIVLGIWVLLAIGERPTPQALLGGVIVLSAVTWRAVHAIRDGRRPAAAGA